MPSVNDEAIALLVGVAREVRPLYKYTTARVDGDWLQRLCAAAELLDSDAGAQASNGTGDTHE